MPQAGWASKCSGTEEAAAWCVGGTERSQVARCGDEREEAGPRPRRAGQVLCTQKDCVWGMWAESKGTHED